MWCHQPLSHYDNFFNSIPLTKQQWWNSTWKKGVLPPHGLNQWEDAALPTHGLNHGEVNLARITSAEPLSICQAFWMKMDHRVLFAYTPSVVYPPILGYEQMTKIFQKCIYEYIETHFYPFLFAHFGGILPILLILGGYRLIFPSIRSKNWGGEPFMLLSQLAEAYGLYFLLSLITLLHIDCFIICQL